MNINISAVLENLLTQEGETFPVVIDKNILLNPFYASVHDIELYFDESVEFSEVFIEKLSEIIFNKSIYIDSYLKYKNLGMLNEEDIYMIKRDYVICAVAYDASKHIYINTAKSTTVKKTLGDFIVERSVTLDLSRINAIGDDAKSCMNSIIDELDSLSSLDVLGLYFVKGDLLPRNRDSYRLWHHPYSEYSQVPIAANKIVERNGRLYKTGPGNGY